jgi:hypothetical protein
VGEAAGVLPPVVALASGAISVTEGAGTVAVAVEVTGSQTRTISVTYSTAPRTAGVGDYIDTGGVLAFAPGQTSRTFFVTLVNDEVEEEVETFTVQLSQAVNGVIGSPGAATVSIIDDDAPAWRAYLPAIHR